MNKWNKFSDVMPMGNCDIWVSDGKIVWGDTSCSHYPEDGRYYWMSRVNPEPPEKEKHSCKSKIGSIELESFECDDGHLYLRAFREDSFTAVFDIVCCPFCGFTVEKDDEPRY